MSITITKLGQEVSFTNLTSYNMPSTGSVNLVAGRHYYLAIKTANASTLHDFNNNPAAEVTGTTGSWTFVAQSGQFNAADPARLGVFRYIPSADENSVVIVWNPSDLGNMAGWFAFLVEVTGADGSTPLAQAAVANQAEDATSLTVTLGSTPTSGNVVLAFMAMQDNTETLTPDTDFTEDGQIAGSGSTSDSGAHSMQHAAASGTTQSNTTSAATSTDDWGGVILELKAAASGGTTVTPSAVTAALSIATPTIVKGVRTLTPSAVAVAMSI